MQPESVLPESLLAKAYHPESNEPAWRAADIAEAHAALADAGYAINYGNVWAVLLGKYTWEWPPTKPANVVLEWFTGDREPGEAWEDYAHRIAQESLEKLTQLRVEDIVDRERLDEVARMDFERYKEQDQLTEMSSPAWEIYYALGIVTEEEYEAHRGSDLGPIVESPSA